jgi:hypothetical protein
MRRPPVQQAATVGVPTPEGAYPREEAVQGWLTTPRLGAKSLTAREQSDGECQNPHMASHQIPSPLANSQDSLPLG